MRSESDDPSEMVYARDLTLTFCKTCQILQRGRLLQGTRDIVPAQASKPVQSTARRLGEAGNMINGPKITPRPLSISAPRGRYRRETSLCLFSELPILSRRKDASCTAQHNAQRTTTLPLFIKHGRKSAQSPRGFQRMRCTRLEFLHHQRRRTNGLSSQISDALLKLKVPKAGFIADLSESLSPCPPYVST